MRGKTRAAVALTLVALGATPLPAFADSFRDCPHCPEMIALPAGSFLMGSSETALSAVVAHELGREDWFLDETPQHLVRVTRPFAVSRNEITHREFDSFAAATGHASVGGCHVPHDGDWEFSLVADWRNPGFVQAETAPAVCLSWHEARAYTDWLAETTGQPYRLLSEAEWEYAARAGTQTRRYWGDDTDHAGQCGFANAADASALAGYTGWVTAPCDDGSLLSAAGGTYAANAFGLHDMLGNVWEWVEDCHEPDYLDVPADGSAWVPADCWQHVMRGGAWSSEPRLLRAAARGAAPPTRRTAATGFRVARDYTPEQ
jgi:formylglycine-generating enzyme required for sulfatase activity